MIEVPDGQITKAKLLASGYVQNTIRNLTDSMKVRSKKCVAPPFATSLVQFYDELADILDSWRIDSLVYERFQSRRLTTPSIETVTSMGTVMMLLALSQDRQGRAITASEWKKSVDRAGGPDTLAGVYAEAAGHRIKPHVVDSIGIGLYGAVKSIDGRKAAYPVGAFRRLVNEVCVAGGRLSLRR